MRKQNSTFKTAFLSEAGSKLENDDYFAYVELDRYACYVIADGADERLGAESARLATQTIILAFQEHPSLAKRAVASYLRAADRALSDADSRERLKASVTVVVTDYQKVRYGYAGNTRLRLYRNGVAAEQTRDMSLGSDMVRAEQLPEDTLSRHEQRNNLYAYLGQGKGFCPIISRKLCLEDGDILALYTRGIWENLDGGELDDVFSEARDDPQKSLDDIEDLLLSKQPRKLEDYSFAVVFVDKVFLDPDRKRRIRKIVAISVTILILLLGVALVLCILAWKRREQMEELERRYADTIEYIQDGNFIRADEECAQALALAEKLKLKKQTGDILAYQKLIEAVNRAEDCFDSGDYEEAQWAYVTAKERSRYADRIADTYIDKKLAVIVDYQSVSDYIQLGDILAAQGDYDRAEEKYLQAKSLATRVYYEAGRQDALDGLEALYESRSKAREADTQEAKEKASNETGAAQMTAEGDKAFAEGDYEGAKVYYAMALEKYQQLGDEVHGELIRTKIASSGQKAEENEQKEQQAEAYVAAGREEERSGDKLEARKQYLLAKKLYKELKLDDKVTEIDGLIEVLDTAIEQEKTEEEKTGGTGAGEAGAGEDRTGGAGASGVGRNGAEPGEGDGDPGGGQRESVDARTAEGAGEVGPGMEYGPGASFLPQ